MISKPFGFKSRHEASALGMPPLPLLILPHPVGQLSDEEMRKIADQSFDEVDFALTHPREEVEAAYKGATTPRSFD